MKNISELPPDSYRAFVRVGFQTQFTDLFFGAKLVVNRQACHVFLGFSFKLLASSGGLETNKTSKYNENWPIKLVFEWITNCLFENQLMEIRVRSIFWKT